MRNTRPSRLDQALAATQQMTKTLIFTLGVIKAAELIFKKQLLG